MNKWIKYSKIILKFISSSLCWIFSGYFLSSIFNDLNEIAAGIHLMIGALLFMGGFFVLSLEF